MALRKKLAGKRDEQNRLHVESSTVDSEITEAKRRLQQQLSRLEIVERITPLRQERATYSTPSEQRSIIGTLAARMVEAEERLRDGRRRSHSDADTMLSQVRNTSSLMRILKRLPRPEEQEAVISALSKRVAALDAERGAAQAAYENSKAKLTRILELDGELSRYEDIGTHSDEREKQLHAQHALQRIEGRKAEIESSLARMCFEITQLEADEKHQAAALVGDAKDVYLQVCSKLQQLKELQDSVKSLRAQIGELRNDLTSALSGLLAQLRDWIAVAEVPVSADKMFDVVRECQQRLATQHDPADLSGLNEKTVSLRSAIQRLAGEIANIDERLAQVERNIIMNASIIGATLTKTYLSDDIQGRKFDTVILDEASMAPIPALWAAALLSENNLIIVGDFKQLGPATK